MKIPADNPQEYDSFRSSLTSKNMEEQNTTTEQIIEDTYSEDAMENMKQALVDQQNEKAIPQSYAIYVDGLRVVSRTVFVSSFDIYKKYLRPSTKAVKVLLWRGPKCPRVVTYIFYIDKTPPVVAQPVVQPVQQQNVLNGMDFETRMREILEKDRMENKIATLTEKLDERDKKIREAEEYIAKLQNGIELLKTEKENKQSLIYERLIKLAESPPDWVKLMILNNTKGEQKQLTGTITNEEAEIIDMRNKKPALSEDDKRRVEILRKMEEELEEKDLHLLLIVNDKLIEEPKLIPEVADLVDVKLSQEK